MRPVYRTLLLVVAVIGALVLWWTRDTSIPNVVDTLKPKLTTNRQSNVAFAIIGDNEGSNPTYNDLIQQIAADPSIQFLVHVGDATPTGSATEWQDLQALHAKLGLTIPTYYVPGNHDSKADDAARAWSTHVGERWRSIDVENIHLVLLDNANRKVGFPNAEIEWLEKDLADAPARQLATTVTLVVFHRPFGYPLANILGDDETAASRKTNERFKAILSAHPVDYIFTGHIHTAIDYTMVLERDANDRVQKSVPVTVSGGGGQPIQTAFSGLLKEKFHALKLIVEGGNISKTHILPKE